MIDFPASPANGQVFTSGGSSWTFDGTKWAASGTVIPPIVTGDNRIINGDMRIDQRWNGAQKTGAGYTVDRWKYSETQAAITGWGRNYFGAIPLSGFPYYLGFSTAPANGFSPPATDVYSISQPIEADAVSDLQWGTASAQPVTLSFLVYSNQTGTLSGCIQNAAGTRSYPFTFNVSASVATKVAIIIPGDTGGTWVMSGNAAAMNLVFDLGCGSNFRSSANTWQSGDYRGVTGSLRIVSINPASFCITGVKLEIGSVATPFNRQSLAKSLADCQRYYFTNIVSLLVYGGAGGAQGQTLFFPVSMRATPTMNSSGGSFQNGSTLAVDNIQPQSVRATITITAVGAAALNGWTYTASAEL